MRLRGNYVKPVTRKTGIKDGLTAGVVHYNYDDDYFCIVVKDEEYEVNAYDFGNIEYVYAKPKNDEYNVWDKRRTSLPNPKVYKIIAGYWSCIFDKQKVRGIIKDNRFIIKKYK